MSGVLGSGGSRTAIETHGGAQSITGNSIGGYFKGMNLTGTATRNATDGISCIGNTLSHVGYGIMVWSYYGTSAPLVTSGSNLRNVNISGNTITLDRDAWTGIPGFIAYAVGIGVDPQNTAPIEGMSITNNQITYLPASSTPPVSDYNSSGINLIVTKAEASIQDLTIDGNVIKNALSVGMNLSATIIRGSVSRNRVIDPAQSYEGTVNGPYLAFAIVSKSVTDMDFTDNLLVDTRPAHRCQYMFIGSSLSSAINCRAKGNVARYADGTAPRTTWYHAANPAGTEILLEESSPTGVLASFNTKAGSKITKTDTGEVFIQTAAPSGNVWKTRVIGINGTVATSQPAAGAASALPATPRGYLTVNYNGTDYLLPAF